MRGGVGTNAGGLITELKRSSCWGGCRCPVARDTLGAGCGWRFALTLTLCGRILYSATAAALAPFLILDPNLIRENFLTESRFSPSAGALYFLLGVWQRFDTNWYIHIATHGYDRPESVVFYPLYPVVIRLQSHVGIEPLLAALLISTLAAFFLFWGLHELLALDLPADTVRRSVVLCGLWPVGFIFFAGYADSLVLALLIWSIFFARTGRWRWAGTLGLLAALTKAVGILVVVPMVLLAWRQGSRRRALWIVLPALGPAIYFGALSLYGRPWPSEAYSSHYWGTHMAWPWWTLLDAMQRSFAEGELAMILNLSIFLFTFTLAFSGMLRREYWVFALAAVLLVLTKHSLASPSWDRYALIAFPAYPNLARLVEDRAVLVAIGVSFYLLNVLLMKAFLEWSAMV